jgi:MOSC domain-containing protein YiiM
MSGAVAAVSRSPAHDFAKPNEPGITLLAGLGVEGDAHLGATVKHRSRAKKDPTAPNLRQVHLLHAELLDELRAGGFDLSPGQLGENVTSTGIDLLGLPVGATLYLGATAVVQVTGLRNPCYQLDDLMPGLMKATLGRDADGKLIRKAGVMSVVLAGGVVRPGDEIRIELPPRPHLVLEPV